MLHKENCNQLYCQLFHIGFYQFFLIRSITLRSNKLCNLKAKTCKQDLLYIIVREIVKTNVQNEKVSVIYQNLNNGNRNPPTKPTISTHICLGTFIWRNQPIHLWENFTLSSDVTGAGYSHGRILWTFPLTIYAFCIRTFYF